MMNLGAMQGVKWKYLLAPISLNGTAATSLSLDCAGFKYATIIAGSGLIGAADMDQLDLTESDDDSSYATISGSAHTDPVQTDDGILWIWNIDCRKRKRYIQVNCDPGAVATLFFVLGCLSVAAEMPDNATEQGVKAQVIL